MNKINTIGSINKGNEIYYIYDLIKNSKSSLIYIARNDRDRRTFRMTSKDGRYSKTHYKVLNIFEPFSYLELFPETGRTHQIRVHMKSIGHPIISDSSYSGGESMLKSFHVKHSLLIKKVLKLL